MFEEFTIYKAPLLPGVILPSIQIEQRHYDTLGVKNSITNYEFLRQLCWRGILEKGIDKLENKKEYFDRVKRELETFNELGFLQYILLNWEVHNFCIEKGIPKGFGRGSCSGSLVLYLLKVTDVDPIKYNLFFERFVSKSRAKKIIADDGTVYLDGSLLADIDSDISYDRRHEVMGFISEKHSGRTSKILTLGTLSSKACLRECGKIAEGLNEDEVGVISDNVPKAFSIPLELSKALEESEKLKELAEKYPKTFKIAKKLEGLIKNTGVHASGIAISAIPLEDLMPIQMTKEGELVSGYEMNDVSSLAVKFDILGLKTLSVVDDCCKQLGIKMSDFNPEEEKDYWPFKNLIAPQGLFQIETDATFRICQKVKPQNLSQLSAVISLSRPGASAYADQYAKYIETGEFQSLHPFLDDVFGKTAGVACYQEQILRALNKIGFPLEDCETCRKIIGKKLTDKMPEWEQKIKDKIKENNLDPQIGDILWKVMSDSANYSFAEVHAVAYSMLTFVTMWLKFNHPKEFFLSLFKMSKFEQEPFKQIANIVQELPLFNLRLLNPDLRRSSQDFTIENDAIRFGLNSIKGVSEKTLECLLSFRDKTFNNKYEIFSAAKEAGLSIGLLATLIQAGCLDSFGTERCLLVLEAQIFNQLNEKEKVRIIELGHIHSHDILLALKEIGEKKIFDEKGKPPISDKRLETLRAKYKDFRKIYDQNHKHKEFANWYFEKKLLGYSYTHSLRDVFKEPRNSFCEILRAKALDDGDEVRVVGTVMECVKRTSKKTNEKYLRIDVSDETGKISALFMDNAREKKLKKYLDSGGKEPSEDDVIIVTGKKNGDIIFADKLEIMNEKIAFKLSQVE